MKVIKAGYEIIDEPNPLKKIERIARVCYKSEDLISEGTDVKMIRSLIGRQHTAMLEHATFAFEVDHVSYNLLSDMINMMETSIVNTMDRDLKRCYLNFSCYYVGETERESLDNYIAAPARHIVSGNMRAWLETLTYLEEQGCIPSMLALEISKITSGLLDYPGGVSACYFADEEQKESYEADHYAYLITDFSSLTSEERMIHETISIQFTVDRGVTHELVRMRDCSFAQESTRYCNYSKGKFGEEITVIAPCFYEAPGREDEYNAWVDAMEDAEAYYFDLIKAGSKPQEARSALPTSVKADIVMTTNLREWKHIFNLRACDSTGPAHPQMKEIMIPLLKELRPQYEFAFGDLVAADEVHA